MRTIEFHAMGCRMFAAIDDDSPMAEAALAQVPGWFESWEQRLSRFRKDSELALLNRQPERRVRVSETLWQVVQLSLEAAAQTDGLVTPTMLEALEAAGYDRSMSDPWLDTLLPALIAGQDPARQVPDWRAVQMDRRRRTIMLPHGIRLDLAGVAKGWAAEQAVRRLARVASALVEASGDIAVSGPRRDGTPWPVGIEHPFAGKEELPLLLLASEAVATSTRGYRRWMRNGKWQHHLIDPRTGKPAETDVFSSTVVGPSAVQAEVGAKAALILGSRAGMDWIEARPHLAVLLVLEDGRILASGRLKQYLWGDG